MLIIISFCMLHRDWAFGQQEWLWMATLGVLPHRVCRKQGTGRETKPLHSN